MKALVYLPGIEAYHDRARMLLALSDRLDRLVLLVGRLDGDLPADAHPHCRIVEAGLRPGRGLTNPARASRRARALIREEGLHLAHDTFGMLAPLFRRRPTADLVCCTSLFCLNAWRLRHVWRPRVGRFRLWTSRAGWSMLYGRRVERRICLAADAIILQAEGLKARLREDVPVPDDRLHVLPNNVDTDFWSPEEPQANATAESDADGQSVRLVSAGTLGESRGLYVLLDTVYALAKRGRNVHLTLIGPIEDSAVARCRAALVRPELNGRVDLAGRLPREALREHLRTADAFLYHTVNDGSPRTVLEALATGLPVVASRHPGIDALDPAGDAIAFVPFGDASATADAVERLADGPALRDDRARAARRIAEARHACDVVADAYAALYRRLLGGGAVPTP